jgi:hypothetical protein
MTLSCTIPEAPDVEGKSYSQREEIDKTPKIAILNECDREFDVLGSVRFIWVKVGDSGEWSLLDDDKNEIIMRPEGDGYIAILYRPDGSSRQIVNQPIPLEYCSGVCEDFARRYLKVTFADTRKPWMNSESPPTSSQIDFLQKQGAYREGMSKVEASFEIRKIIASKNSQRRLMADEPLTPKQMYFLKHNGVDTRGMSKLGAMQAISRLKQNQKVRV